MFLLSRSHHPATRSVLCTGPKEKDQQRAEALSLAAGSGVWKDKSSHSGAGQAYNFALVALDKGKYLRCMATRRDMHTDERADKASVQWRARSRRSTLRSASRLPHGVSLWHLGWRAQLYILGPPCFSIPLWSAAPTAVPSAKPAQAQTDSARN